MSKNKTSSAEKILREYGKPLLDKISPHDTCIVIIGTSEGLYRTSNQLPLITLPQVLQSLSDTVDEILEDDWTQEYTAGYRDDLIALKNLSRITLANAVKFHRSIQEDEK